MEPLDSAHQIGLATLLIDVLTVDEGVWGWWIKNCDIGDVFEYGATPSGDMLKRTAPSDSAQKIGPTTLLQEVLTRVRGHVSPDLKKKGKSGKSDPISFISVLPGKPQPNRSHQWIQRIK